MTFDDDTAHNPALQLPGASIVGRLFAAYQKSASVARVLSVFGVGEKEQTAATEVLRRFSHQDLTLTDAVGLHLMKAQRLRACWSTDFHLGLTGVPLVINESRAA